MDNQSEMFRKFMKFVEIYRRSQNQPEPEETLSGREPDLIPKPLEKWSPTPNSDRRKPIRCMACGKEGHPATYCMPVPSSSSSTTTFDPCIVCKGKHPLWKCAVFKEKTPTQRAKEQLEMTRFTTSIC